MALFGPAELLKSRQFVQILVSNLKALREVLRLSYSNETLKLSSYASKQTFKW